VKAAFVRRPPPCQRDRYSALVLGRCLRRRVQHGSTSCDPLNQRTPSVNLHEGGADRGRLRSVSLRLIPQHFAAAGRWIGSTGRFTWSGRARRARRLLLARDRRAGHRRRDHHQRPALRAVRPSGPYRRQQRDRGLVSRSTNEVADELAERVTGSAEITSASHAFIRANRGD
jgi:hypothetical protein